MKSKVVAQKWLWWSDCGKIFNNNNSGKFVADSQIHVKKFCHYQTTTANSGLPPLISQFFHATLFCIGRTFFLQFGWFFV